VHVLLLGTAAGGGFPQWNCWCRGCTTARTDPAAAHPRTQSSAAVSADGQRWFLLNASPDVREQLSRLPQPAGRDRPLRHVPVEGVLLTDAEIDHSLGVVLLREGGHLPVYTTAAIRGILERDSCLLPVTRAFAEVPTVDLQPGVPAPLPSRDGSASGLTAEAFVVPADPPRFARNPGEAHSIGLIVRGGGATCAFVPACGDLDHALLDRLAEADILLFDGTFWDDRELIDLGIGTRTARQMDHVPMSGPGGSLDQLARLPCRHRIYTHINNTNPVLLEASPQRAALERAGLTLGRDGLSCTVGADAAGHGLPEGLPR
jgi:pyrroloquinoline quinone biosynthesis protein B